uniref:AAA ATPase AAA+ lid domain-containing protein n=1 Tax=Tetranychus urticae TaxID=32264 RepID=T1JW06_TETUR
MDEIKEQSNKRLHGMISASCHFLRVLTKESAQRSSKEHSVYIETIDVLIIGRKRSGTRVETSGEEEQTLNRLLVEMDGKAGQKDAILLSSTNIAEVLDKALLRPEIFEKYLKDIKLSIKPEIISASLTSLTPGFSGADIANVCNESALKSARYKRKAVTLKDLEYAVEKVNGGIEKSQPLNPGEKKVLPMTMTINTNRYLFIL